MDLLGWADETAGRLSETTGVPIATDERDLRVPGGLLYLDRLEEARLGAGVYDVTWNLALMATGPDRQAMTELGRMAGDIAAVEYGLTWDALTVRYPNLSPDPMPVLQTTITTECED